ncbi:hypothetical protein NDU88_003560 [Pleurodeles waltl]|uniref:Uncharacterized protein n=1 Tax=Pleurodeles waltl TaxID=8319 RepID=A0AAV7MUY5_PLEWA|nr:hypothetical protein NDU88_003560 [Pleurodeles waltl]
MITCPCDLRYIENRQTKDRYRAIQRARPEPRYLFLILKQLVICQLKDRYRAIQRGISELRPTFSCGPEPIRDELRSPPNLFSVPALATPIHGSEPVEGLLLRLAP